MGSEVESTTPKTLSEIFKEVFPYYLAIGMTYDQFWNQDPELVIPYRKASEIKLKLDNQQAYLIGAYVYEAIGDLTPILNPLSKEHKARPYRSEPYALSQEEADERQARKDAESLERLYTKLEGMADKNGRG